MLKPLASNGQPPGSPEGVPRESTSREARGPIELIERGASRDSVALLVASQAHGVAHRQFLDLGDYLSPGDVVVVNDSATLPAAITTTWRGARLRVHVSAAVAGSDRRLVEFRTPAGIGSLPRKPPAAGTSLELPGGGTLSVVGGAHAGVRDRQREALLDVPGSLDGYLSKVGEPIRYAYVSHAWPLTAYQTIFAKVPGSSEMASAGRPFSHGLVAGLQKAGVLIVPVTLHTGVASQERGELPAAEPFKISVRTATILNAARQRGSKIIATGTSVVRALESCVDEDASFNARDGFTDLVISPRDPVTSVDGLITGWHDEDASHLLMLEAIAGRRMLQASYDAAKHCGYRWHEFGDSHLILRDAKTTEDGSI